MSLQTRISDLITAIGTDIKQHRTWITGSASGNLTGLTTTVKTDLVAAINEVKAGNTGSPPAASETVAGVIEIATQTETTTGTDDVRAITPLKLAQRLSSFSVGQATEAALGTAELATQTEVNAGTDDLRIVTPLKFQTRLAAYAQPLDSDLTSIAALTTTAYGRDFLALANQAGLQALLGLDTDVTLAANSDAKIATQKATKAYADALLDANNAFQYKGVQDCSTNPNYPAASAGWTYKVSVAGKIGGASGLNVEIGDTLVCLVDSSAAGTQVAVGANWIILQTNIDGGVVGPASSTAGDLATYSGTTGKVVQDSGVSVSTDGTMATNNNTKVPTEGAIRTYLGANYYTQTNLGNYDTDLSALYTTAKA